MYSTEEVQCIMWSTILDTIILDTIKYIVKQFATYLLSIRLQAMNITWSCSVGLLVGVYTCLRQSLQVYGFVRIYTPFSMLIR